MENFKLTRVYANEAGDSYFEDVEVPLYSKGPIGYLSENFEVKDLSFRKVSPEYDYDFHTAPARQYIILLDGEIEIETSLGEKRIFGAGDVLFVEDTNGKGHRTKNLQAQERKSIFVTI
ncbi:hypothetical protein [Desertivirga arenae]|uniref:hypothetical protein n=1 Tax=Desertivirga arenae TaxID=2810309 RepID=UPI001A96611F|nr:hypothetical protein [Pedobacter sp. SYSU D00823]